jgi:DNA-3-methyladenine glycosylase
MVDPGNDIKPLLNVFESSDSGLGGSGSWSAPRSSTPIDASFFNRSADVLARDLIGRILETTINGEKTSGIITETAAYTGADDHQSHKYKVRKGAPAIAWAEGSLYIYSTQGHTMVTVTSAPFSHGATVLIRALEPLAGCDVMQERSTVAVEKITIGPGNLSRALGITAERNGHNILTPGSEISILSGFAISPEQVRATRRKGDTGDAPALRFSRVGSEWVS